MNKINSFQELIDAHEQFNRLMSLRKSSFEPKKNEANNIIEREILVCGGTGCQSADSIDIIDILNSKIKEAGLSEKVDVKLTGCFGFCENGPIVKIYPDDVFYVKVKPSDAEDIVYQHLLKDKIVERLLYEEPATKLRVKKQSEMSFYKKQKRIALRNCGFINPEDIRESIAQNGYTAMAKVITSMTQDEIIKLISDSKLRGRGGGGFPTGKKWSYAKENKDEQKYVICNADEGDPGAFMDRSILEGDPHSVLEAMTIAGYAIGASKGYIYIRAEYPLAVHRIKTAVEQARDYGLLGDDILDTDFNFDVTLKYGAGRLCENRSQISIY